MGASFRPQVNTVYENKGTNCSLNLSQKCFFFIITRSFFKSKKFNSNLKATIWFKRWGELDVQSAKVLPANKRPGNSQPHLTRAHSTGNMFHQRF